ncbi:MAG: YIP1 family protein [Candidatus Baltobacteraceae bacterium]
MTVDTPLQIKRSGLVTVLDTIVSPSEAFETLREVPMWGWAFIVAIVLMIVAALLERQASAHAGYILMQQMIAHNSTMAQMPDAKKQQMLANAANPPLWQMLFGFIVIPVILLLIVTVQTVILVIGNAVGKGQASFKQLWCALMNIAVASAGIGGLVIGIIALVRGPNGYNSIADIQNSLPSLAFLSFGNSGALSTFLAQVNPFSVWGAVLSAIAMLIIAKTSKVISFIFPILILLLGGGIAAGLSVLTPK